MLEQHHQGHDIRETEPHPGQGIRNQPLEDEQERCSGGIERQPGTKLDGGCGGESSCQGPSWGHSWDQLLLHLAKTSFCVSTVSPACNFTMYTPAAAGLPASSRPSHLAECVPTSSAPL